MPSRQPFWRFTARGVPDAGWLIDRIDIRPWVACQIFSAVAYIRMIEGLDGLNVGNGRWREVKGDII